MECEIISLQGAGYLSIFIELFSTILGMILFSLPALLILYRSKASAFQRVFYIFISIFLSKALYIFWIYVFASKIFYFIIMHIIISIIISKTVKKLQIIPVSESEYKLALKDYLSILLLFALIIVATIIPQSRIALIENNQFFTRAYFIPDYMKHIAVTAELAKETMPPRNPFFTGHNLHYYWIYYLIPSFAYNILSKNASLVRLNIFSNLIVNLFLMFTIYIFAKRYIRSTLYRILIIIACFFATSYEGIMYVYETLKANAPLFTNFINYNIDGLTRWRFGQPQIDTLYRSLLYTPQQQLGFVGLLLFIYFLFPDKREIDYSKKTFIILPVLCGIILGYNFFCGLFIIIWFFGIFPVFYYLSLKSKSIKDIISRFSLSFFIFLLFPLFYKALDMLLDSKDPVNIGFSIYHFRNLFYIFLVNYTWLWLSILILCVYLIILIFKGKYLFNKIFEISMLFSFVILGISLISFMQIRGFEADVGLKIGQVLNIILFFCLIYSIKFLNSKIFNIFLILLIVPGFITTIIDFYNTKDIEKAPEMFITTFRIEDVCAMQWIRNNICKDAVIQTLPERDDPRASIVPIFGERRIALGDEMHAQIYILQIEDVYKERKEMVYQLFYSKEKEEVLRIAEELNIDFVFVGTVERDIPEIIENLERFPKAYEGFGTTLYDLRQK